MNTQHIVDILELATSLLRDEPDERAADTLLDIIWKASDAYVEHTGEPLDPDLIQPQELLTE